MHLLFIKQSFLLFITVTCVLEEELVTKSQTNKPVSHTTNAQKYRFNASVTRPFGLKHSNIVTTASRTALNAIDGRHWPVPCVTPLARRASPLPVCACMVHCHLTYNRTSATDNSNGNWEHFCLGVN